MKRVDLVQSGKLTCSRHYIAEKLALNNNHLLTHSYFLEEDFMFMT